MIILYMWRQILLKTYPLQEMTQLNLFKQILIVFFCLPTTPEEIVSLLRNIKSNTSSGFDNIEPHIMREINPQIAPVLSHIFNNSFSTGVVPRELKIAKVIPIHKNNDPNNFCNYRPISILPCFSQNLERLMYNRLERFLNQSHIISEVQYGLRKKYSTYMALINLIYKISSGTDSISFNIGIFIDLYKAFDTIDHNILFQKRNCYMTQYVTYNNVNSNHKMWCATRLYTRVTIIYTLHQRPLQHFNYYEVHSFCR